MIDLEGQSQMISASATPSKTLRSIPLGIRWVLAFHLVTYPVIVILTLWPLQAANPILVVAIFCFFISIYASSISLLGIWIGLGQGLLWQRILQGVLGLTYISIFSIWLNFSTSRLIIFGESPSIWKTFLEAVHVWGLNFILTALITTSLFILRYSKSKVMLVNSNCFELTAKKFQFSIRELLVLMFAIAVFLGANRAMQLSNIQIFLRLKEYLPVPFVALATVWAVLWLQRPLLPLTFVTIMAACLGALVQRGPIIFLWPMVIALQALGVGVPLLILRSYGYRLAKESMPTKT